jgi:hypothetical protein
VAARQRQRGAATEGAARPRSEEERQQGRARLNTDSSGPSPYVEPDDAAALRAADREWADGVWAVDTDDVSATTQGGPIAEDATAGHDGAVTAGAPRDPSSDHAASAFGGGTGSAVFSLTASEDNELAAQYLDELNKSTTAMPLPARRCAS